MAADTPVGAPGIPAVAAGPLALASCCQRLDVAIVRPVDYCGVRVCCVSNNSVSFSSVCRHSWGGNGGGRGGGGGLRVGKC